MRVLFLIYCSVVTSYSAPAWTTQLTGETAGSHPMIEPSVLDFSLSWKGMVKAGKLRLEFSPQGVSKPGSLVVKSTASSLGPAATLFPYTHSYWSEIQPGSLRSKYFHSIETDDDESVVTINRYSSGTVVTSEATKTLGTGSTTKHDYRFPFGPARDMFSAILHIRSQTLNTGDNYGLLLLPFKSPYLLTVTVEGREKHLGKESIRLSFSMRKIDRDRHTLVPYKKLKKPVTLWLSDDDDRIPLEVRASVYIGDVRAILTHFKKTT
ncbi:DUF3108 domain-containing protein [Luteolibacter algae]|uniref:DUF3108 domain-containing protein n=1 Tax=Luteolibacter algae TaxID=454151 RepID=A0ABW5D7X7_9BACT